MCCTEGGSTFRGTVFRVALYFPHSAYVSSCKLVFAVYHGRRRRRRSVFRSVLCCSVFRFTSDRPKLRTRPSFSDQAPTVSKVQRITRCKTQFRFPTGQFRELREPHFLPERASLIAPLAHNSSLFSLSLSLFLPFSSSTSLQALSDAKAATFQRPFKQSRSATENARVT